MFATNPISIAIPTDKEPPFVLDMATSTVAVGKLAIAMRKEEKIPLGWAMNSAGELTEDPKVALDSRRLTPLGGTRELGGHKGYGLAVMVDALSGVLSGAAYGDQMVRQGTVGTSPANVGHFFGAIKVDAFRPADEFKAAMDDMLRALKNSPKAEGHHRIYVAGEIEFECEQERLKTGIPLNHKVVADLQRVADELEVPFDI
jgi:LDH2 family malate/lactate/ureidoglycolate dehydrogenase